MAKNIRIKNIIIFSIIAVVGFFLLKGCISLMTGPEGGVRLSNEMEEYAVQHLADHNILNSSESIIAYYDTTLSLTGEEAAILTNQRIIYHNKGMTDSINLKDVVDIKHRKEQMIGDIFEIYASSGKSFKIEVAPFNQGETFKTALFKAWANVKK